MAYTPEGLRRMSTRKKPPSSRRRNYVDPNQTEFGIIWKLSSHPFRLRALRPVG